MTEKVVVTGMGIVSPIGLDSKEFWDAALRGEVGVGLLPPFEGLSMERYRCRVAATIPGFDETHPAQKTQVDRLGRCARLLSVATREALKEARLTPKESATRKTGILVGSGMGAMLIAEREMTKLYEHRRPDRVHPNFIPQITLNSMAGGLGIDLGFEGPNLAISTACSSSAHAIGLAMDLIRAKRCDTMVACGAEAAITPLVFAGFNSLRAMSTGYNDEPKKASRPFDADRDGFVMGEGAAALILESESHALSRGATILAEVAGYGMSCEAHHMVIPMASGEKVAETLRQALADAGLEDPANYHRVGLISAHGTSTPAGDIAEIAAIRRVFGSHADRLKVSALKSQIGHCLGAAGTMAAVAAIKALIHGKTQATANFCQADDACQLPGIADRPQEIQGDVALVNAFAFGSNNACIVFKRSDCG